MNFILAIDQGTTGTTAVIVNQSLEIVASATVDFPQYFPKPGWVEHDLNEIWRSVAESVRRVLTQGKVNVANISAIGITNQRETTCLWKKDASATPLARAIVWQDRRTTDLCAKLKKSKGVEKAVNRLTGLKLDPYFSATKLRWILDHYPEAARLAKMGQACFGTIDSYLLYRLTGEHRTEPSNACRTLLMNLKTCEWDETLLKLFKIPRAILPEILPSMVVYGTTKKFLNLPDGIPVSGMAGDQQAALFGQACFMPGSVKCTYGTGAFALVNTGTKPIYSRHQLLTSVGWRTGGKTTYVLEGSAFIAGAAVQWLRDGLGFFKSAEEVEHLARAVEDSNGVVFVPALSGMGAPHWIPTASGLITGITRGVTRNHIARATLEGVAFQVKELLEAMKKDLGKKIATVKVDGGASTNHFLMQFQADLLNTKVVQSKIMETTSLGAAMQAGLAIGFWKDTAEIEKRWQAAVTFTPQIGEPQRKTMLRKWNRAMAAVRLLAGD